MNIRTNDLVQVISGDDKGKRGKVVRVNRKTNQVVVQGVNLVWKHVKPNRRNPQGGRLSMEMPVDVSKVAYVDPVSDKPTRVAVRFLPDGTKELYAKKSGATIRVLAKADPKYAKK
ncbi:50S ribosomal protein L24 [Telmatocola sphagniphila]|jgi:large subunit ribosomal protein L24|uniref:Large ribosomal subunit protein uL24 n=1 Tax=Telmatocola sphagniphila TaxID=1123043 RepID=A0A8E6ERZ1_9BACT|nr:50S ribosomal protein L24 [Telmatocola sphagniphila]QVL29854.1 50S ribosomal protein L24 [Telmatocola sphagniphila]